MDHPVVKLLVVVVVVVVTVVILAYLDGTLADDPYFEAPERRFERQEAPVGGALPVVL